MGLSPRDVEPVEKEHELDSFLDGHQLQTGYSLEVAEVAGAQGDIEAVG